VKPLVVSFLHTNRVSILLRSIYDLAQWGEIPDESREA